MEQKVFVNLLWIKCPKLRKRTKKAMRKNVVYLDSIGSNDRQELQL